MSKHIFEVSGGLPMQQFVDAMVTGIRQTPECLLATTPRIGVVAMEAHANRLTMPELAASTLEGAHLDRLVNVTVDEHTRLERRVLAPPAINNQNLPTLLPMFYRFSTHGVIRAAAAVAGGQMQHAGLREATSEEVSTAEAFLATPENFVGFLGLVKTVEEALGTRAIRRLTASYKRALLGIASPPEFDEPLTAKEREDRRVSLTKTNALKARLAQLVQSPVEELVLAAPVRKLRQVAIKTATEILLLP